MSIDDVLQPAHEGLERSKAELTPPAGRSRRVLIVDDSRDAADGFARVLQMVGHEVRVAYDGASALATGSVFEPSVVLMDIAMPGMSGYEAARRLRDAGWGRDVLLVALSGFGQSEDRDRSRDAGFDHHLVKPVEVTEILNLIERHFDQD